MQTCRIVDGTELARRLQAFEPRKAERDEKASNVLPNCEWQRRRG